VFALWLLFLRIIPPDRDGNGSSRPIRASALPKTVDLVLLDGAKSLYSEILNLVESRLRPGAFVVADNTDYSPEYMARICLPEGGYLSLSFADDVEISMRLG
jgi:predicted O-methyltransferase YrrM